MNYTSKDKKNQPLSHLIICIAFRSRSSEPIDFNYQAPQRQDFLLDTPELSCDLQAKLTEILQCVSRSRSDVTQGCALSASESQVFELTNSERIDWTVGPETERRFLEWWAVAHPFFVTKTLFKDEFGIELIVIVSGLWTAKEPAGHD